MRESAIYDFGARRSDSHFVFVWFYILTASLFDSYSLSSPSFSLKKGGLFIGNDDGQTRGLRRLFLVQQNVL